MLEFEHILYTADGHVKRQLNRKGDSAVLLMEGSDGTDYILRIYNQVIPAYRVLTGHNCPCLPGIYHTEIREGLFAVKEEFIDGVSLQEMISGGARMDEQRTADILASVSEGLACLHEAGFIHRDVKPEHVMLTAEKRIVLLDLDASMRIILEKPEDTQLIGTAVYAAPEQFGLSRSDCRTDIYAMGILMNEMLTGDHPAVTRYRSGPLAEIIGTCIEMNPADRYQSVSQLMEAVRDARSRAESQPTDIIKGLWPRKILSALAVCMLAFAILLGASGLNQPSPMQNPTQESIPEQVPEPSETESETEEPELQDENPEPEQEVLPDSRKTEPKQNKPQNEESQHTESEQKDKPERNTEPEKTEPEKPDTPKNNGTADSMDAHVEGTEYLQLHMGRSSRTVYYHFRCGTQSAPLYTEDGRMVDETWQVYADPSVGRILKWDEYYQGWTLISEGCEIGSTGYLHAEKDGLHYAIQVLVMGEPMSAYTRIPELWNLEDGYLKPKGNVFIPDEDVIEYAYQAGEEVTLYLAAMRGFDDLMPSSTSPLVTIEPYTGNKSWNYPVFVMKFRNPEGKNTVVEVTSNHNSLTFYFTA